MHIRLRSYKIRKILSLVDFHSLYQLLQLQFLMVKFVLINERESNRKLPKMFAGKSLWITKKKKSFTCWFTQKRPGTVY